MPMLPNVPDTATGAATTGRGGRGDHASGQPTGGPAQSEGLPARSEGWSSHSGNESTRSGLAENVRLTMHWRKDAKKAASRAREQTLRSIENGRAWSFAQWDTWVYAAAVVFVGVLFSYEFKSATLQQGVV